MSVQVVNLTARSAQVSGATGYSAQVLPGSTAQVQGPLRGVRVDGLALLPAGRSPTFGAGSLSLLHFAAEPSQFVGSVSGALDDDGTVTVWTNDLQVSNLFPVVSGVVVTVRTAGGAVTNAQVAPGTALNLRELPLGAMVVLVAELPGTPWASHAVAFTMPSQPQQPLLGLPRALAYRTLPSKRMAAVEVGPGSAVAIGPPPTLHALGFGAEGWGFPAPLSADGAAVGGGFFINAPNAPLVPGAPFSILSADASLQLQVAQGTQLRWAATQDPPPVAAAFAMARSPAGLFLASLGQGGAAIQASAGGVAVTPAAAASQLWGVLQLAANPQLCVLAAGGPAGLSPGTLWLAAPTGAGAATATEAPQDGTASVLQPPGLVSGSAAPHFAVQLVLWGPAAAARLPRSLLAACFQQGPEGCPPGAAVCTLSSTLAGEALCRGSTAAGAPEFAAAAAAFVDGTCAVEQTGSAAAPCMPVAGAVPATCSGWTWAPTWRACEATCSASSTLAARCDAAKAAYCGSADHQHAADCACINVQTSSFPVPLRGNMSFPQYAAYLAGSYGLATNTELYPACWWDACGAAGQGGALTLSTTRSQCPRVENSCTAALGSLATSSSAVININVYQACAASSSVTPAHLAHCTTAASGGAPAALAALAAASSSAGPTGATPATPPAGLAGPSGSSSFPATPQRLLPTWQELLHPQGAPPFNGSPFEQVAVVGAAILAVALFAAAVLEGVSRLWLKAREDAGWD